MNDPNPAKVIANLRCSIDTVRVHTAPCNLPHIMAKGKYADRTRWLSLSLVTGLQKELEKALEGGGSTKALEAIIHKEKIIMGNFDKLRQQIAKYELEEVSKISVDKQQLDDDQPPDFSAATSTDNKDLDQASVVSAASGDNKDHGQPRVVSAASNDNKDLGQAIVVSSASNENMDLDKATVVSAASNDNKDLVQPRVVSAASNDNKDLGEAIVVSAASNNNMDLDKAIVVSAASSDNKDLDQQAVVSATSNDSSKREFLRSFAMDPQWDPQRPDKTSKKDDKNVI